MSSVFRLQSIIYSGQIEFFLPSTSALAFANIPTCVLYAAEIVQVIIIIGAIVLIVC